MRFFRRSLVGLFLAALTLGLLAFAGQIVVSALQSRMADQGPGGAARERVFSASVQRAVAGPATPVTQAFGEVRSLRRLELRSPRAGTVVFLAEGFADGAAVLEGQLLLRLDPADAQAQRDLAAADLSNAEAEQREAVRAVALARDDLAAAGAQAALRALALKRQQDILARGIGSEAAVETAALAASAADQSVLSRRQSLAGAEARVDQAATALQRATIALAEAERAVRETELFAGFAGVLNGVSVVQGGILGSNESIGELIDPEALEVAFRLSNSQFSRLIDADGALLPAAVQVSLDVQGAQITTEGRLTRVGAAVGEGQSGRLVYADLAAPRGFRPGDFVTVRVAEPPLADVVVLPATAVGPDGTLLVLGPDDRLEAVRAEVLRRQDNSVIVAAAGIAGREVVTERTPLLGAGIKVRPIRPEASGAHTAAPETPAAQAALPETPALVELTPERRAELIAVVEASAGMPAEAKARTLDQLAQDRVPARLIARLEQRTGG